ncbi:MAG: enoyl-CoA hydratase/isomerase family protein [Desulfatitalea sp.]|nr:enoyl-CoA hydratase/isomerase family protein [Desulfatitalea sp.]NNK01379.1 enoyl-CoA hydratase/isomerase family protein [Desulfatitalea sp.]
MELETVRYLKSEHIATVILNRPDVLNAMNKQLWLDLQDALADARRDSEVKVVVITGQGRAFSSGADLKESKLRSPEAYRDYLESLQRVSRQIIRFPKPTIAAINGYALGSGYELALACDIRLAAENAKIGSPEARVASSITGGALRLIQDLVGPGKAKELLFTATSIDGFEAERIGLVNKVVAADDLMEVTYRMAASIAQNSPFSLKMIKRGLRLAQGEASLEALMDFEVEACLACVGTRDRTAALETFEKRKENGRS